MGGRREGRIGSEVFEEVVQGQEFVLKREGKIRKKIKIEKNENVKKPL